MSAAEPAIKGASAAQDSLRDWEAVRATSDIQYAPLPPVKPPETPDWLRSLAEWLRSLFEPLSNWLGMSWPIMEKVLIGLAVIGAAFLLWRIGQPLFDQWQKRVPAAPAPERKPHHEQAVALLEDADRLAAEGRYGEAAHLLLQRSVHHIAESRPEWVHPATTAREIALLPPLPERARSAFAVIAARVERSLFALRALDLADWQAARAAYADFALAEFRPAEARP